MVKDDCVLVLKKRKKWCAYGLWEEEILVSLISWSSSSRTLIVLCSKWKAGMLTMILMREMMSPMHGIRVQHKHQFFFFFPCFFFPLPSTNLVAVHRDDLLWYGHLVSHAISSRTILGDEKKKKLLFRVGVASSPDPQTLQAPLPGQLRPHIKRLKLVEIK